MIRSTRLFLLCALVGLFEAGSASAQQVPNFAAPVTNPFGLVDISNSSTPSVADLDGDGDLDVLAGSNNSGSSGRKLRYFENTAGAGNTPTFASPAIGPFGLTDNAVDATVSVADLDGDGDLDVLTGDINGIFLYFENTAGAGNTPAFATGVTDPFGLIDIGTHSAPSVADLDGDGDLDVLSGNTDGKFYYFENTAGAGNTPTFASPVINPFVGLNDIGNFSKPTVADLDADGDQDVLAGNFNGIFRYYENTAGAGNIPAFASSVLNPFGLAGVGLDSAPSVADFDSDGDLDVLSGASDGKFYYFENIADPDEAPNGVTAAAAASLSAIDAAFQAPNDVDCFALTVTDPTLFSASTANAFTDVADTQLYLFEGDTDGATYGLLFNDDVSNQDVRSTIPAGSLTGPAGDYVLCVTSFDSDPRNAAGEDLFAFDDSGCVLFTDVCTPNPPSGDITLAAWTYEEDGATGAYRIELTGAVQHLPIFFDPLTNPLGLANVREDSAPSMADLDGDGDLDVLAGRDNGNFVYFENTTGAGNTPAFATKETNPFGLTDVGVSSAPSVVDFDGDGDQDVLSITGSGDYFYYENTAGAGNTPAFAASVPNPFGLTNISFHASAPAVVDLDSDGDLDVLSGEFFGRFFYFENTAGAGNTPAFATKVTNPFGLTDIGGYSAPSVIDLDGDGDLDVLSGELDFGFYYFENTAGAGTTPAFAAPVETPFDLTIIGQASAPSVADFDSDGDLDVLSGEFHTGNFYYFENIADPDEAPNGVTAAADAAGLTTINAGLQAHSDVDCFALTVTDPTLFSASTANAFTDVGDTQLYLFDGDTDGATDGLLFNDDASNQDVRSTIPAGSLTGPAGDYVLCVTSFDSDPRNAAGEDLFAFDDSGCVFFTDVCTPNPASGDITLAGWSYEEDGATGDYRIELTGVTDEVSGLTVTASLWLEGPWNGAAMEVHLSDVLPQDDPYNLGQSVASGFFDTSPGNAVVDWIWLELRSDETTVEAQTAALLMHDGSVKTMDATSDVVLDGLAAGSYYLVIGHRNHLSVMSSTLLDCTSGSCTYDFRSAMTQAYGTTPLVDLAGDGSGPFALVTGDADQNGQIQASDKNSYFSSQVGQSGYKEADFDLNAQVQASDKNAYFTKNVGRGSQVPATASVSARLSAAPSALQTNKRKQ